MSDAPRALSIVVGREFIHEARNAASTPFGKTPCKRTAERGLVEARVRVSPARPHAPTGGAMLSGYTMSNPSSAELTKAWRRALEPLSMAGREIDAAP